MEKTNRKKKVNRRVKKTIRKTFGMLFLISALLIAAIPVQNLEAQTADVKVTIDDTNSKIPVVETTDEIYTTGDGIYQFAYISPNDSGQNKIAVILGYNSGYLEGGYLEIPDTVNAYAKFSDNFGSNSGYTAVSKNGKPLFYEKIEPKKDPATGEIIYETEEVEQDILDEEGNPTGEKETVTIVTDRPVYVTNYYPCFYEDRSNWEALNLEEFYVRSGGDGTDDNPYTYTKTTTADNQWIKDAIVAYIGNQYLKTKTTGDGWEVAGEVTDLTSDRGIFANNGNITNLKVGKNLRGIGNYAFIGCTSLNSIDLGNGLDTIGNWAFANCLNITQINLDISSTITILGDHAFYNCQGMTQFTMPIAVQKIGDSAFEGCFNMEIIELCGNGKNVALNEIGSNVFKDCTKLSYLQLPATYMESDIDISLLKGCTSLRYVSVPNANANFKETAGNFGFEDFKAQVPEEFYFEGPGNSEIHTTATEYEFAFKYLDEDCYEIIKSERDANGQVTGTATYRVNSHNELIYFLMSGIMNHVDMPNTIGPYKITVINSGSFKGNCNLTTIAIPSSVVEIKNGAFQGCHNLKNVIFKEPVNVTAIGENAFQTQMVELHGKDCPDETLDDHPVLNFVGRISYSSAPFVYAMDPKSKINIGSQYESYINFYSTWPESLIVKYNSKTDKNELIGYPSKDALLAADFPYMNEEEKDYYREAASVAFSTPSGILTDDQLRVIDAAYHIDLPEGIESIQPGLFSGITGVDEDGQPVMNGVPNQEVQSVRMATVDTIEPYTFTGCNELSEIYVDGGVAEMKPYAFADIPKLTKFEMTGGGGVIGDYAFDDNSNLSEVTISPGVYSMGLRPFRGCPSLAEVDFNGSSNFTCNDAIIFTLNDGTKKSVVECLEARGNTYGSSTISKNELAGVTGLMQEAFQNCNGIGSVDLSDSKIAEMTANCFADTGTLYSVILPGGCKSIDAGAFRNSNLRYIDIPNSVSFIDPDAFDTNANSMQYHNITFYCEEGSNAEIYANKYDNIVITDKPAYVTYTVYFWDWDQTILDTQTVEQGQDAVPPEAPTREGYRFDGWAPSYLAVSRDLDIVAQYTKIDSEDLKHTVTFVDYDDTVLGTSRVATGETAYIMQNPSREGYIFIGWRPDVTNVTADITTYAQYEKIDSEDKKHTVTFVDYDDTVLYTCRVGTGEDAFILENPVREGYRFTGWRPAITGITQDVTTYAQYEKIDSEDQKYTVTFVDYNDKVIHTSKVAPGENTILPNEPARKGYTFIGWRPDVTTVTSDVTTYAQYVKNGAVTYKVVFHDYNDKVLSKQTVEKGKSAIEPKSPTRKGYKFVGWKPDVTKITKDIDTYAQYEKKTDGSSDADPDGNGNNSNNSNNNGNNSNGNNNNGNSARLYTVTVENGSGSGSYAAGATVIISAKEPAANQQFKEWVVDKDDVKPASKTMAATTFVMPARNVTIKATFQSKTASDNTGGTTGNNGNSNNTGNTGNNNNSNNTSGNKNNNTSVSVDKNGISNTGVVSATVNGSSDDFVVKITESAAATEAVTNALTAEYGSLDHIKYFPMDISLYDATGNQKITDTTGLSVSITIPLPDSLITYAGNNKVAGVVNDKLDKLTPKFTTIDGVSCVTFTAEHFSPYTIYVDTGNLSAGVADTTPKTGDGIHPKWFLSFGMLCIAMVLFLKKDSKNIKLSGYTR